MIRSNVPPRNVAAVDPTGLARHCCKHAFSFHELAVMPLLSRTPYGRVFGSSPTPGASPRVFRPVSCTIIRQPIHWRCRKPTAERRSTAPSMPARRSTPNPSVESRSSLCRTFTYVNRDEARGFSPSSQRSSNPLTHRHRLHTSLTTLY